MNVTSSVGIIMANKQLMSSSGFAFTFGLILLSSPTFTFSLIPLLSHCIQLLIISDNSHWIPLRTHCSRRPRLQRHTGLSASKHIPLWELLWFSLVANVSIAAMNFSLMLNSVGFYQISKLSMIPVVCVMEWVLHNKHYSREVKASVLVVVVGVGICTVTDVKVNAKGFICASTAVFSTSLQQISIGSLQKKYSVGSFELLSKTAPIQALSLLTFGPFVDYFLSGRFVSTYKMSYGAILCILLSCALAVFCNISQYLCIGRFSATSFQVLGHMKTVCVLTLGWLLFDSEMTVKNVAGMVIYSWAVELEKQRKPKATPHGKNSMTEDELRLLKEGIEHMNLEDMELGR
ncbi:hypothetical protein YC2023_058408 [Brassica napus]